MVVKSMVIACVCVFGMNEELVLKRRVLLGYRFNYTQALFVCVQLCGLAEVRDLLR